MSTAVNGSKKCVIYQYDKSVFSESDCSASLMTHISHTKRGANTEVLTTTTRTSNFEFAAAAVPLLYF